MLSYGCVMALDNISNYRLVDYAMQWDGIRSPSRDNTGSPIQLLFRHVLVVQSGNVCHHISKLGYTGLIQPLERMVAYGKPGGGGFPG